MESFLKNKWIWFILGVIILIPPILNWLIKLPIIYKIVGDDKIWLSFLEKNIGGILSSCIAIFILFRQLRQNHQENNSNRQLQISVFRYGQKMSLLQELRKALVDFQVSFNYLEIDRITEHMINGNYNEDDSKSLTNLIREVDEKGFIVAIIIQNIDQSDSLNKCKETYNVLYHNYGTMISDLLFFYDFIKDILKGNTEEVEYFNREIGNSTAIDPKMSLLYKSLHYEIPKSIRSIIMEINDKNNIEKSAPDILRERLEYTNSGADLKEKLKQRIVELISFEKEKLDEILIKK